MALLQVRDVPDGTLRALKALTADAKLLDARKIGVDVRVMRPPDQT